MNKQPRRMRRSAAGFCRRMRIIIVARIDAARGKIDLEQVEKSDTDLHHHYREMAVANGVDADNPILERCQGNNEEFIGVRDKTGLE